MKLKNYIVAGNSINADNNTIIVPLSTAIQEQYKKNLSFNLFLAYNNKSILQSYDEWNIIIIPAYDCHFLSVLPLVVIFFEKD